MRLLLYLALLAPPTVRQQQQYHERAVKARVQAWRMFVNECQHRSWKHGYRHPSWCKVVK
jgi:hypothetical protein